MDRLCGKHHLQGVWGRLARPAGSARGKARSHAQERICHLSSGVWGAARPPSGEREGQSPLACAVA
jgi:hypothetical protein